MAASLGSYAWVNDKVPCPNCGGHDWEAGILTEPPRPEGDEAVVVEVHLTPMARCVGCGWSERIRE